EGSDVVKVVDFGIAKAVGGDDSQKVTKTGLVVGTPEFMSPEQLSGDKLDGRSDLYSLALVLFKTLTGKLPFEATTVQETMIKRRSLTPAVIGAVVVLGGGGAAVAVFGGGGKGTRQVAPSVRADTASRRADTGGARTAGGPSRRETGAARIGAHRTAIDPTKA